MTHDDTDFFNHRNDAKSGKRIREGNLVTVGGEKELVPGSEVFVNYHKLPNAWLLTNYGARDALASECSVERNTHPETLRYGLRICVSCVAGFLIRDNEFDFVPLRLDMPYLAGSELEALRVGLLGDLGLSQEIEATSAGLTTRLNNLARVCGLNKPIGYDTRDEWVKLDMDVDLLPVSEVRFAWMD